MPHVTPQRPATHISIFNGQRRNSCIWPFARIKEALTIISTLNKLTPFSGDSRDPQSYSITNLVPTFILLPKTQLHRSRSVSLEDNIPNPKRSTQLLILVKTLPVFHLLLKPYSKTQKRHWPHPPSRTESFFSTLNTSNPTKNSPQNAQLRPYHETQQTIPSSSFTVPLHPSCTLFQQATTLH
jgi:hypothetical protein